MTAVQASWIKFLANHGYGWEDIAAKLKASGEPLPAADIRALVIKKVRVSCMSS